MSGTRNLTSGRRARVERGSSFLRADARGQEEKEKRPSWQKRTKESKSPSSRRFNWHPAGRSVLRKRFRSAVGPRRTPPTAETPRPRLRARRLAFFAESHRAVHYTRNNSGTNSRGQVKPRLRNSEEEGGVENEGEKEKRIISRRGGTGTSSRDSSPGHQARIAWSASWFFPILKFLCLTKLPLNYRTFGFSPIRNSNHSKFWIVYLKNPHLLISDGTLVHDYFVGKILE